jgi:hypothetical protein
VLVSERHSTRSRRDRIPSQQVSTSIANKLRANFSFTNLKELVLSGLAALVGLTHLIEKSEW